MNTQAKLIVAILVAAVVGLGITVGVMAAGDGQHDTDTGSTSSNRMMANAGGYQEMMGAMGSTDREDMLKHMRDVLGEDGYQRMLAHLADRRNGTPMTGPAGDEMMHTMMDGMMNTTPTTNGTVLPPGDDQHHESPVPATTPAP